MLQQEGVWNDLSPKLRERLEQKILSFGKVVRFKFNISHPDPDPEKKAAKGIVYPANYTLKQVTFNIDDKDEKREGKQRYKKIGMVETTEVIEGRVTPKTFKRVRVEAKEKGQKKYELEKSEDVREVMYLLLHPRNKDGFFPDPAKRQEVSIIDEQAAATASMKLRSEKRKALNAVEDMSHKDLVNFADAMGAGWDSSEDETILRNKAEDLAENDPAYFNDKISGKKVEYGALVKQAMARNIITFDPAEYKFAWAGNKQTITVLSPVGLDSEQDKFAEWLQVGGTKADEVAKKLKSLVNDKKEAIV